MKGCHILLFEKEYQEMVFEFMANPDVNDNKRIMNQEYLVKFTLRFKVMGNGDNSMPYFYMEINDIRKKSEIKTYQTYTENINY